MILLSCNNNRTEFADIVTNAALDAFFPVQHMGFFFLAGDRFLWAFAGAEGTSGAGIFADFVMEQGLTDTRRALLIPNMGFIFLPEIFDGGEHRVGCRGAQAAQGELPDHIAQFLKQIDVPFPSVSLTDAGSESPASV